MRALLFYLLLLEGAFLLEGFFAHFPLVAVRVDLVWLLVLYLGFTVPLFPGGIGVVAIGLAREAAGVPLHGILPFSYLTLYLLIRMTRQQLFFEGTAPRLIWVVVLTLARQAIEGLLLHGQGYTAPWHPATLLSSAFLQAAVALFLFPFLQRRGRIFGIYGS